MVVTWGLSDRHSWIVRRETYQAKWRADEAASRPLPFDADLEAKPAFEAIARCLRARTRAHGPARDACRPGTFIAARCRHYGSKLSAAGAANLRT